MISGKDFKSEFGEKFFKFIRKDKTHNGFIFRLGENVDFVTFNPSGQCQSGGLYFTNIENIMQFRNYGLFLTQISIPDDSQVYVEQNKFKTNKFIIDTFEYLFDSTETIIAVKQNGNALKYVKEQTPELCLVAVKQNSDALRFIKEQTPEICLAAVNQYGRALEYVKEKTPEICLAAVN